MKKCFLLVSALLLLFPLCFFGCGQTPRDVLPRDFFFSCRLEGTIEGKPFAATVENGTIQYSSPEALSGITATIRGNITLGDTSIGSGLPGFVLPLWLIAGEYDHSGHGTAEYEGALTPFLTEVGDHGTRRVWLSREGTPIAIVGDYNGLEAEFKIYDWQRRSRETTS